MFQQWQRYSVYKDSGIEWLGEIPEHWVVIKLKYNVTVNPSKDGYFDKKATDLTTFLPMEKVSKDGIVDYSIKKPVCDLIDGFTYFRQNDIIFAKITPCFENGKGAFINKLDTNYGFGSTEFHVLRAKKNIAPLFVFFITKSQGFLKIGEAFMTGSAGQKRVSTDFVSEFKITSPPLIEQKAIARFLDRETAKIDTLIQKKKRLIELLQEKRTAIINQAVTKGLNPGVPMKDSGIEWLGEIPEHWGVKRLKFILAEPLKYGANESAQLNDRDCPRFIRITDIAEDGSLREDTFKSLPEDIAKPFILKIGDLLFARSGATVGKTFMYREYWGRACYAGYLIRARLNLDKTVPEFISYFANSSVYWNWISSILIQATIENVSAEKYANLFLSLPLVEEQKTITRFLDRETTKIDTLMAKTRTSIEKFQEYRTALISAAVTGKIDVRNNP